MPRLNSRSLVLALGLFWGALLPLFGAEGPGKLPRFPATKALPELPHPDAPRVLNAAYYSLRSGFRSTLMLSNQGPHPMSVQIKLFNLAGEPFALDPVTLAAGEMRGFDLRGAAPSNGFEEGSVQVLYQGVNLELGGALNAVDASRGLIFGQELTEPATSFASSRLEGVWWRPTKAAKLELAVSNTTDDPLTAKVGFTGVSPRQKAPVRIALRPHETRVLKPEDLADAAATLSRAGGLSIVHDGPKGALLAVALIGQSSTGYSDTIELADPRRPISNRLEGAGLRIGRAGGRLLNPVLIARNAGTTPVVVRGRVPYTDAEGQQKAVPLPAVRLAPGEVRDLGLAAALTRQRVESAQAAGLEIQHTGAPGSVVLTALAVSGDGSQVFRVPLRDAALTSSTGIYPWSLEGNERAIVYLKNATGKPQEYTLHLETADGNYVMGKRTAAAGETVAVDLRDLRDRQVPDVFGQTLPRNVERGKAHWSMHGAEQHVFTGRLEQADLEDGMSFTVACGACCPNSFVDAYMDPYYVSGGVGGSTQFTVYVQERNCFGSTLPWYPTGAFYYSTNSSVASVTSGGVATALYPGSTFIQGTISTETYRNCAAEAGNEEYCCDQTSSPFTCEAECQVQPSVTIDKTSPKVPYKDPIKSITLTATGTPSGGTFSWTTTSSLVTLSNATSATVTVTSVNPSMNKNDVPIKVTYTVNGASANATANATVQKPTSLAKVGTDSTTSPTACMAGSNPGCSITRTFDYQVKDQWGDTMAFGNMPFTDAITTGSQNGCNLGGYNVTPAGQSTMADGTFHESLGICAPACRVSGTCVTSGGCTTTANQVWTINGVALSSIPLTYRCFQILANGS
jgi:hypothetical protein